MSLRRSAGALHSLNRFYRVDVVVFCEGGESLAYEDAVKAAHTDGTLDALYWEAVISSYGFQKKYHVKSVGSKQTLSLIARDAHQEQVTSVSVCMDSDYDRLRGTHYATPRSAWTRGYSWENDVVTPTALESIAAMLAGSGASGLAMLQELRDKILRLEQELQRWTEIDISLCARGYGGLFDRDKPLAAVDMNDPPTVRHAALSQRLGAAGYHRKPRKVVSVALGEVACVCYGKLVSRALYHAFVAALRRATNLRLDYEVFMRLAISETMKAEAAGLLPNFSAHVHSQRNAFV